MPFARTSRLQIAEAEMSSANSATRLTKRASSATRQDFVFAITITRLNSSRLLKEGRCSTS